MPRTTLTDSSTENRPLESAYQTIIGSLIQECTHAAVNFLEVAASQAKGADWALGHVGCMGSIFKSLLEFC